MVASDITKHEGLYGSKGYYKTRGTVWWQGILQNMRDGIVARDITKHEGWYGGKGYNIT